MFSTSADIGKHYSFKRKVTIGADLFYDGTLEKYYRDDYPDEIPKSSYWYYGIHIGHEWIIQRYTIAAQLGWMLKDVKDRNRRYGRIAFRYDITKNLFARVGLKLPNNIEADFLEWGLGINFYKQKLHN